MSEKKTKGHKVQIDPQINDGIGIRNFKKFFELFVDEFVERNKKYFDETRDLLYIYRERQLNTAIAPILDKLSTAFLCEHPTTRKSSRKRDDESHGWIDYWVKDNSTIYLIELKHAYNRLSSKKLRQKAIDNWEKAKKQLKCIKKADEFALGNENVIKIALMFVVTYTSESLNQTSEKECSGIKELLIRELKLDEQYVVASLTASEDMLIDYEYENGNECYPYVHIIAQIVE